MQFLIGAGKSPIKCFKKDVGMMGYGMSGNTVDDLSKELSVRSFWMEDGQGGRFVYSCAEICFITPAVRREVMSKIRNEIISDFDESCLMLSAQHTHSGPGGYSEYALYNFTIPGFRRDVFTGIVDGIFNSIEAAYKSRAAGSLELIEHSIDAATGIAWNRSIEAYNSNPENEPISDREAHLAIDNRMRMLRINRQNGPCDQINWFGVHATCIGKSNHSISFDNKGFAAAHFENMNGGIGVFAQGLAGDVSPYYHGPEDVKKRKGINGENEHVYAETNGIKQADEAMKALSIEPSFELKGPIETELVYCDFSNIQVSEEFSHGLPNAKTGGACHGVSFFNGTRIDGRGLSNVLNAIAHFMCILVKLAHRIAMPFKSPKRRKEWKEKYRVQGKKRILMDASEHRIFGTTNLKGLIIPGFADPTISEIKREYNNIAFSDHPWVPHILPIQIVVIGKLALVGCPGEPTITAGKRIEGTMLSILKKKGVDQVVVCPYSNAYMGYITTFEEYQLQTYEGGHTVYGQWTLGAFQTKFKELACEMLNEKRSRNLDRKIQPIAFSRAELERRTYD